MTATMAERIGEVNQEMTMMDTPSKYGKVDLLLDHTIELGPASGRWGMAGQAVSSGNSSSAERWRQTRSHACVCTSGDHGEADDGAHNGVGGGHGQLQVGGQEEPDATRQQRA